MLFNNKDMEVNEDRTSKSRRWCELEKAVRCNWSKTNWQLRNDEKMLAAQLKHYQKERQQIMRLMDGKKCELEKRLVGTGVARPRHVDGSHTEANINIKKECPRKKSDEGPGNFATKVIHGGTDSNDPVREKRHLGTIGKSSKSGLCTHEILGRDKNPLLPARISMTRQNVDSGFERENYADVNKSLDKGFAPGASLYKIKSNDVRKVSSWEHIPNELEKVSFLPDISEKTEKKPVLGNRCRSYTVSERSSVYIPAKERKRSSYIPKDDFQEPRSLEEQFEKLQGCRYLRSTAGRE